MLSPFINTAKRIRIKNYTRHNTVLNKSDFLDARLPYSGRNNSGNGISMSEYGFAPFYKTKALNFKLPKN